MAVKNALFFEIYKMTSEFDDFIRQLMAAGCEKLDGYSLLDFNQFSDDERIQAIALLKTEVIDNGNKR